MMRLERLRVRSKIWSLLEKIFTLTQRVTIGVMLGDSALLAQSKDDTCVLYHFALGGVYLLVAISEGRRGGHKFASAMRWLQIPQLRDCKVQDTQML